MQRQIWSGFAILLAACQPAAPAIDPPPTDPVAVAVFTAPAAAEADIAALAAASNRFSADIYFKAAATPGNVMLSPVSITGAFGLLRPGAAGETASEIDSALGYSAVAPDKRDDTLGALMADLETHVDALPAPATPPEFGSAAYHALRADPAVDFSIANAAWVDQNFVLKADYAATIARAYDASVSPTDFSKPETAAARINQWVEDKTNKRIKDLVKADQFNGATRLVLTNAVWFKARWRDAFEPNATQDAPFFGRDGKAMPATLMNRVGQMPHFKGDGFAAIDLAYTHPDFALSILLPDTKTGLAALETKLGREGLLAALDGVAKAPETEIFLTLPKLTLDATYDLIPPLEAIGMRRVFDPTQSELPGLIEGAGDLFVSSVTHKTFFQMDEFTTEAAAATAIVVAESSAPAPPIYFRVDHPFLLVLRHKPTGTILFIGRVEAVQPA